MESETQIDYTYPLLFFCFDEGWTKTTVLHLSLTGHMYKKQAGLGWHSQQTCLDSYISLQTFGKSQKREGNGTNTDGNSIDALKLASQKVILTQ